MAGFHRADRSSLWRRTVDAIYDMEQRTELGRLPGQGKVLSVTWSPRDLRLVAAMDDTTVRVGMFGAGAEHAGRSSETCRRYRFLRRYEDAGDTRHRRRGPVVADGFVADGSPHRQVRARRIRVPLVPPQVPILATGKTSSRVKYGSSLQSSWWRSAKRDRLPER